MRTCKHIETYTCDNCEEEFSPKGYNTFTYLSNGDFCSRKCLEYFEEDEKYERDMDEKLRAFLRWAKNPKELAEHELISDWYALSKKEIYNKIEELGI